MESGHAAVRQLHYLPAIGAVHGVETLSFDALRAMDTARLRTRPQRPDFHVLALVTAGRGGHEVDFAHHALTAGSVVWIRPGYVHRWSDVDHLEGPLVLFQPGFLPDADLEAAGAAAPACWQLPHDAVPLAELAADHLDREHRAAVARPRLASRALLAHLLAALVLRVLPPVPATGTSSPSERSPGVFDAYRAAVEEHFTHRHRVGDYAGALGYDVRTLTRATRAATGTGAKAFLDQRILLEAKRLLAPPAALQVGACARRLGFRDTGNFTTFFRRQTGRTPTAWTADFGG